MNTAIETLNNEIETLQVDATEHGSAFTQINTGEREGVSLAFTEGRGWHATSFDANETHYTDAYGTPQDAITELRESIETGNWFIIR